LQKKHLRTKKKGKKEREGRKEEKRKSNSCTLGFCNGYFEDQSDVFKNLYVFHFLSFFIFKTEFFGTIKGDDQEIQIIE